MFSVSLNPAGHLALLEESGDGDGSAFPDAAIEPLRTAARTGPAELLLCLATMRLPETLPPVFGFWRRFGERYLTELCHVPESGEDFHRPLAAPLSELEEMAGAAPPMRGGEYLRSDALAQMWAQLDQRVRDEVINEGRGLPGWLQRRAPLWQRVGRVCFHLAENKRDPEYPFAFLATYAPKLLDGVRVQYQPLGKALEEFAGADNRKLLINLLAPVQRAAEKCGWVKELVDGGDVFHPLAWTPNEAHRLLMDMPVLEASGLLVRVPDWWTRRAPRVRVGVSIGQKTPARFGADAMLDFKVGLAVEGEEISAEEWENIRRSTEHLVFVKGRWVEIDRERLKDALEHWKQVEQTAGDNGISFLDGMRMLAGAPIDAAQVPLLLGESATWADVRAGDWLAQTLRQLRQPDALSAERPPPGLKAILRPYQQIGVQWLRLLTRLGLGACLADDMGLGKTIQVLSLLLMQKDRAGEKKLRPAVLVLPASLLANWRAEIERFAPGLDCRYLHPSQMTSREISAAAKDPQRTLASADLVLTTYALLSRWEWLAGMDWSLAILDEAQAIKNPAARQTRAVKQLKAAARIVLTGTPVENRLTDLWSIFDFINPGLLGAIKTFGAFTKRLEQRAADQYGPLRKLVSPYILRRLKTDKSIIADLPDKTELRVFCGLSKKQAVLYQESVRELDEALRASSEGITRRGLILAFILRFKQICNHPAQWLGAGDFAPRESGKFQRLREIAEELAARQERALIFTQFRGITEPLAQFLAEVFGRTGLVLHGDTAIKNRKRIVDEFQREDGPPFLVLSLKAGGTGLNLTAATHVVHFDRWWNPAVENQATDRAFRIGQTQKVMVHKFVCQGTIEERIDALISDKTALAGEILSEGVPRMVTEMSDDELLDLVRLDINKAMED